MKTSRYISLMFALVCWFAFVIYLGSKIDRGSTPYVLQLITVTYLYAFYAGLCNGLHFNIYKE